MSRSLNLVQLIGNLTRDPIVRYTPNGSMVCSFSIATNRSYKKADGTIEEVTEYHDCEAWSKLAEICSKQLTTGSNVYVKGELRTKKWVDQSGQNRIKVVVRMDEMIKFLSRKDLNNPNAPMASNSDEPVASSEHLDEVSQVEEIVEEDMPF
jgi:single-strand DNA-binding protein